MPRRQAAAGSALFLVLGTGVEVAVGPWLLTRVGLWAGAGWPAALRALGVALILAGGVTLGAVVAAFARHGGTPSPAAPAARLIVAGAYRHVRHPMYLAAAVVLVGEALAFAQPILLVAAAAYVVTLAAFGRLVEEPRLTRRFGDRYLAYRRHVPAWWPRRTPWRG